MEFTEYLKKGTELLDTVSEMSAEEILPLLCSIIDMAAEKREMTSLELIQYITPVIKAVNEMCGEQELRKSAVN